MVLSLLGFISPGRIPGWLGDLQDLEELNLESSLFHGELGMFQAFLKRLGAL